MSCSSKRIVYKSFLANAETVYRAGELEFCVYDEKTGKWTFEKQIETEKEIIKPPIVLKKYAEDGHAFLPSEPEEYGDTLKLADEIYRFLYRYADYPDEYRQLDPWYCFLTWVYDLFPVLPYRRALGDTGHGKSRWAKVLGSVCRLAFLQGAATRAATLFRLSDAIRGTQIIDENNFNLKSEEGQAIILILNSGYDRTTGFVTRCEGDSYVPTAFVTFGPKLIASRYAFPDEATENRTITHHAYQTDRTDIPIHLEEPFWRESLALRNKLLLWRFRNLKTRFTMDSEFLALKINPRLKEVLAPICAITQDKEVRVWLRGLALELDEAIAGRRAETKPAEILTTIWTLKREGEELQVKTIADKFNMLYPEYPVKMTAKALGVILRRDLGLITKRKQVGRRAPYVVVWDEKQMARLAKTYGLEEEWKEALTSITSLTSKEGGGREEGETKKTTYPNVEDVKEVIEKLRVHYPGFRHWTEFVKAVQSVKPDLSEGEGVELFRRLAREGKLASSPEGMWKWV